MRYEDIETGRRVIVTSGKHKGKTGLIADFWPPSEPTVILDIGGEYGISEVELVKE